MHSADIYLKSIGKFSTGATLSIVQRQTLDMLLQEDADSYYQASLFSFVDGLRSVPRGFYSFATVKLYYSVFYALRARLAIAGHCIFYDGTKGRHITTEANAVVTNSSTASTHKLVFSRFRSVFPNDFFLSQEIDGKDPLEWLVGKREAANYGQGRFSEPLAPAHLQVAATTEARQFLGSYVSDDLYIHDGDHAVVAFPLRVLVDLRTRLSGLGLTPLSANEVQYIESHMRDSLGPIPDLVRLL